MKLQHRLVLKNLAKALTYVNNKHTNLALEQLQAVGGIDHILDEIEKSTTVPDAAQATYTKEMIQQLKSLPMQEPAYGFCIARVDIIDKKTRYHAGAFNWSLNKSDAIIYVKREHAETVMCTLYLDGLSVEGV